MVTMDKSGNPIIKTEVMVPYEVSLGPAWHRFFEGLQEEKIWGTRCSQCRRVLVPARGFCPRCFVEMKDWVEVSSEGVLLGWSLTDYEYFGMPLKPPFINCSIKLDGSDCGFMHVIGGFEIKNIDTVRANVKNGMRVKAVWQDVKKGSILDIKHFKSLQD